MHLRDRAFVHVGSREVAFQDQVSQPLGGEGIEFVVIVCHALASSFRLVVFSTRGTGPGGEASGQGVTRNLGAGSP